MATRQVRRAARKAAARFVPQTTQPQRRLHPGVLPRTRDYQDWLAFIDGVYAARATQEQA
jgi:hypothetical protein